jgi:AraC-like DNA-binding protein
MATGSELGLFSSRFLTDRPREIVEVHRPLWLERLVFWNVSHSERHWSMHHETYAASLVLGPSSELRATWRSRGEERIARPGSVQLLSPGEAHSTTAVSEPASFFVLWCTAEAMAQVAAELDVPEAPRFGQPQLDGSPATQSLLGLQRAVTGQATRLEIDHHCVESLRALITHAAESPPSSRRGQHPGVRRAVALLNEAFDRNLTLEELAREAKLSKFHFARCFRQSTGLAPHRYQQLVRLQQARGLIERGSTVEEAAARTGFADAPHLTRQFRSWLGVAPGQWARATRAFNL